jgi:hypothetical protein
MLLKKPKNHNHLSNEMEIEEKEIKNQLKRKVEEMIRKRFQLCKFTMRSKFESNYLFF